MKPVQIREHTVYVDDEDYERISTMSWHPKKNKNDIYFEHSFWCKELNRPRTISLQRVIMGCAFGDGKCVDHINGDTLNNCKSNLRITDANGNAKNQRVRKNKSGYKGVDIDRYGRYRARITVNFKTITLGTFATPEEAHEAYKQAASKYFGEYARNPEYYAP